MPAHSKKLTKKIILLFLVTLVIGSSVVFSVSILGNTCSQLITHVAYYYNTIMGQRLIIP